MMEFMEKVEMIRKATVINGIVHWVEVVKPTRELWDALLGAGLDENGEEV